MSNMREILTPGDLELLQKADLMRRVALYRHGILILDRPVVQAVWGNKAIADINTALNVS